METQVKARLPSIRELELSCPTSSSEANTFGPYALSPTYTQFPSPPALTPSANGSSTRLLSGEGPFPSQHSRASAERASGSKPDIAPAILGSDAQRHGQIPHPLPPQYGAHQPPRMPLNMDINSVKRPFITTPPRSPDRTPLAPPSHQITTFPGLGEASSSSADDAIAETRRQRRESKERRRRRDQRSLTVCMEQSVPSWVFSRLKTRHSASKVNGGGRATNAVISGACIWLRVLDRAMQEKIAHWTTSKPAMDRWMALVDDEAATLENWDDEDDSTAMET